MIVLRLARHLCTKNQPIFNLVAIPSSKRLTARPLEVPGTYDPLPILPSQVSTSPNGERRTSDWGPQATPFPAQGGGENTFKMMMWNKDRFRWWLSQVAQPSKRVRKMLETAGGIRGVPSLSLLFALPRYHCSLLPPSFNEAQPPPISRGGDRERRV